jgi:hypothetical protein
MNEPINIFQLADDQATQKAADLKMASNVVKHILSVLRKDWKCCPEIKRG